MLDTDWNPQRVESRIGSGTGFARFCPVLANQAVKRSRFGRDGAGAGRATPDSAGAKRDLKLVFQAEQSFSRIRAPESAAAAGACFPVGSRFPHYTEALGAKFSLWRFFNIGAIRSNWLGGLRLEQLGRTLSSF